jgi:hypothetical protein
MSDSQSISAKVLADELFTTVADKRALNSAIRRQINNKTGSGITFSRVQGHILYVSNLS